MPPKTRARHRTHSEEKRERKKVAFSPTEWALVEAAAATVGLRPGAFVGQAAVGAAKAFAKRRHGVEVRTSGEVQELTSEVRELRRLLGNVSGNVNDIAKHANSTHELNVLQADAVLAHLRRNNDRIDSWLMKILRSESL
ncbi:hypothetical protein [Nocardia fluminea]|uniref:hypothetical protein n=1 Tax=Nocardia fluminea TaxID=134984 RepID=UPI003D1178BA